MESENIVERMEAEMIEEPQQGFAPPLKFNMDVNTGINLSIVLTLVIFCGLLFLPSKMLLHTSYEVATNSNDTNVTEVEENFLNSMKFREKKLCPGLNYEYWLSSIYFSNYDRNCTWMRKAEVIVRDRRVVEENGKKKICTNEKKTKTSIGQSYNRTIDETRTTRPKSVPVTGHILAMMLVVSAVAAFVEVLRIRFINPKDSSTVETAGSRKGSTVELMSQRRFLSRDTMKNQRSFEIQGMQRSNLRIFGPPPLVRRSSFPTYHVDFPVDLATISDTTTLRSTSRRPSINSETIIDPGMHNLHRRARLIRRH